jgi:hypothetical protein
MSEWVYICTNCYTVHKYGLIHGNTNTGYRSYTNIANILICTSSTWPVAQVVIIRQNEAATKDPVYEPILEERMQARWLLARPFLALRRGMAW